MKPQVKTRAKFEVISVTQYARFQGVKVEMTPVYSNDESDPNKAFWEATPNGKIEMQISNPSAAQQFEVGKEYYVDFSPAN
jgi:hypothetical protein